MKITSRFLIGAIALIGEAAVLDSCRDYFPDTSYLYNYSQYANFRAITVNNPCDDHFLSIYYDQPFSEEGGVCAKAYLGGKGPFTMQLNVPSHVKQLYVVDNGVLTVHPVADLEVGAKTRGLEYSQGELDALYSHVTSTYLQTAQYNVTGDDLFKCTDIRLERDGKHNDQALTAFNISLIDLMNKTWSGSTYTGEKKNFIGNLFAYVYPKEKQHHLTLEDCIFFGANPDGYASGTTFSAHMEAVYNEMGLTEAEKKICPLKKISAAELRALGESVRSNNTSLTADQIKNQSGVWPLLNAQIKLRPHIVISLPVDHTDLFPNGCEHYNLGFVYLGGQNLRFTTPALNIGFPGPADSKYGKYAEKGNYLGYVLDYKNAQYDNDENSFHYGPNINDGKFVLDRHVANGFIWHFKYTYEGKEKEYDVLGMDNQYPFNQKSFYDADYADYKVLISTDPEYLKPVEELLKPIHTPFTLEEGYYLFEDTYPDEGDYDYNDVIVQYEWRHYPEENKSEGGLNRVNCTLEGYACEYYNTFGFINTHENAAQSHHPLFTGIHGMMNVKREPDFIDLEADNTIDIEYEFVGNKNYIYPYLNNGNGDIYQRETTGDFKCPFVLIVPEVLDADENEFRWAIEGARLEDAYNSITGDGWYLPGNIKDKNKLMKRHNTIGGDEPSGTDVK